MKLLSHIRLLPILVVTAFLSFAVRIGDFAGDLSRSGSAFAQHEVTDAHAPPLPAEGESAPAGTAKDEKTPPESVSLPPAMPGAPVVGEKAEPVEWKDAGEAEFEYSPVQAELYKDLAARRKNLEAREKQLATREALLEAGEREVEQKLRELTAIRGEIEGLLQAQGEEEQARVKSLVTIYEGMKAKDAAGIFNTLDMDVLITIFTNMSERKSAAILAEMNPERARTVTILMAQQRQLPAVPMQ